MSETSGTYTLDGTPNSPITEEVAAGAAVTFNIIGDPDIFNITADAGATVAINQTTSAADTLNLIAAGGTISLQQLQTADTITVTIRNDGEFITNGYFGATQPGGSVTFGSGGGALVVGIAGTYRAATTPQLIYGFNNGADDIDDKSVQFSGVTGYTVVTNPATGYQTVTILAASGNYTFTSANTTYADGTYASGSGPLSLFRDATGGTNIAVASCFLDDVLIATPQGERPVQQLRAGDQVCVRENGATVSKRITWVGSRTVRLGADADRDAFPVRVRKGAIADGVPHRDLLVTSEHCVHVEGRLVPVRMLVNGASIVSDTAITGFTFHHVELERHGILLADGLEVESYLDTGNRSTFDGPCQSLRPDLSVAPHHRSWADAAAPLAVDRQTVGPIWDRIAARAGATRTDAAPALTREPRLRLLTRDGTEIDPVMSDGTTYGFVVPAGAAPLRLASRAASPTETVGPFVDDRRRLGVFVGRIGVGSGAERIASEAHLSSETLSGWHGLEGNAGRWTDGNALLPIDGPAEAGPVYLDIEVLNAGPYPVEPAIAPSRTAA